MKDILCVHLVNKFVPSLRCYWCVLLVTNNEVPVNAIKLIVR